MDGKDSCTLYKKIEYPVYAEETHETTLKG